MKTIRYKTGDKVMYAGRTCIVTKVGPKAYKLQYQIDGTIIGVNLNSQYLSKYIQPEEEENE